MNKACPNCGSNEFDARRLILMTFGAYLKCTKCDLKIKHRWMSLFVLVPQIPVFLFAAYLSLQFGVGFWVAYALLLSVVILLLFVLVLFLQLKVTKW